MSKIYCKNIIMASVAKRKNIKLTYNNVDKSLRTFRLLRKIKKKIQKRKSSLETIIKLMKS